MTVMRRFFVLTIALTFLLTQLGSVHAQSADMKFFPETGHNVRGEFLKFYENVRDPNLVYGYPLTEQFVSRDGKTVQYFQRARFELTTSGAVALTPIGRALHQPATPLDAKNPFACEAFAGIPVCYAFLDFYKKNGGTAQFGNPLAPAEENAGVFMQYFDYARFEWRTNGFQSRVTISDLGTIYFHTAGEDRAQLNSIIPQDATIDAVLSIRARAFVARSITQSNGSQTVSIVVQSQTLQPVANANGIAIVRFPDATTKNFTFTTNQFGIGQFSFDFSNVKAGELVLIEITVNFQNLPGRTTTSFRIWH